MSNKTRTGWVYVLTNESIAGQVKVGYTSGRPEDRAKELNTTGVPTPYKVATAFLFSDKAMLIEQRAHRLLNDCRVSSDREFFRSDAKSAAHLIKLAGKQLDQTPAAVEPVLLTPEEIAARERQEAEQIRQEAARGRLEKRREEAHRQQRKAEEEKRRRKLECRRQQSEKDRIMRNDTILGWLAVPLMMGGLLVVASLFEKCTG